MDVATLKGFAQGTVRQLAACCGVNLYSRTDDRRVLEQIIFPYVAAREDLYNVLFVGCAWYTRHYPAAFPGKQFWTLELDPARRKYGAQRHITDSIANLGAHFEPGSLDVIFCNGVFGHGLNTQPAIDQAFRSCYDSLRPGGIFMLGWNDTAGRRPYLPQECAGLKDFVPLVFPPLVTAHYLTDNANRHIFDFYEKRGTAPATTAL